MPTLLLYYPEKEKRWTVEVAAGKRFTIGRAPDVEVCIPHTSVSKKHLLVERKGPHYTFRDLESKNGVYLNDFRTARGSLENGDEIRLGSITVTFYEEKPPAERLAAFLAPSSKSSTEPPAPKDLGEEDEKELAVRQTTVLLRKAPEAPNDKEGEKPPGNAQPTEAPSDSSTEPGHHPQAPLRPARAPLRGKSSPPLGVSPQLAGQRRWSVPVPGLVAAGLACVALGLVLGYLGSLLESSSQKESGEGSPAAQADNAPVPSLPAVLQARSAPSSAPDPNSLSEKESLPEKEEENPLGPTAEVKNPETRGRLVVRLYLDIFGRPPTRDEMEELSSSSPEDLWVRVSKGLHPARSVDEQVDGIFPRFLGWKADPSVRKRIFSLAKGDPDHYAFLVAMSQEYASVGHRRKRPDVLLAQSLCVNLLESLPKPDEENKTLEALRDPKRGARKAAEALLRSNRCKAGPREGDSPENWVRGAYSRCLLRFPKKEEEEKGTSVLAREKDGWRKVLLDLTTREEYLKY